MHRTCTWVPLWAAKIKREPDAETFLGVEETTVLSAVTSTYRWYIDIVLQQMFPQISGFSSGFEI
jgi:hypothetical protein